MGCGNPKEKIENEMIKITMIRSEIQMERLKQMELLKEIDGTEIKAPIIPDYIDQNFLQEKILEAKNSSSTISIDISPEKLIKKRKNKSFGINKNNNSEIIEEGEIRRESKKYGTFLKEN